MAQLLWVVGSELWANIPEPRAQSPEQSVYLYAGFYPFTKSSIQFTLYPMIKKEKEITFEQLRKNLEGYLSPEKMKKVVQAYEVAKKAHKNQKRNSAEVFL